MLNNREAITRVNENSVHFTVHPYKHICIYNINIFIYSLPELASDMEMPNIVGMQRNQYLDSHYYIILSALASINCIEQYVYCITVIGLISESNQRGHNNITERNIFISQENDSQLGQCSIYYMTKKPLVEVIGSTRRPTMKRCVINWTDISRYRD